MRGVAPARYRKIETRFLLAACLSAASPGDVTEAAEDQEPMAIETVGARTRGHAGNAVAAASRFVQIRLKSMTGFPSSAPAAPALVQADDRKQPASCACKAKSSA